MRYGLPHDPAPLGALLAAVLLLAFAPRILRPGGRRGLFLVLAALAATLLSAGYIALYLRGGPRIIDASSYWLEARALAEGHLAFPITEPAASTLGRFLVRVDAPDGPRAAVIFPPGWPALLALGFLARAPLAVGPILAALIVLATFALAERIAPDDATRRASVPRLAALLSAACAALRYHTADTMSHGLSALLFAGALALVLGCLSARAAGRRALLQSLAAGLCAGWLFATRPFSGLALAILLAIAFASTRDVPPRARIQALALLAAGALPGLALLAAHQHAATGSLFTSSQRLYYAVSDGPPDCFRWGFGKGIGCVGEHGDFVQHNLPHGFGAHAAAATTLRRLKQHLVDAGNAEPFIAIVLLGAVLASRERRARLLVLGVLLQIAAYVPFYFDGNYPGGGARFYADVLPLEHVLAALAITHLAARIPDPRRASLLLGALVALVPLGFSFRTGFDHASLRDRDGGLPMFEPARLSDLPPGALVFVDTDHGFNLGFDPAPIPSTPNRIDVRRWRGDLLDQLAWLDRGKPPAYRYLFPFPRDGEGPSPVSVVPLLPADLLSRAPRIEGESLWPPLRQEGGYTLPAWSSLECASAGRMIAIHPVDPTQRASVTFSLPARFLAGRTIAPRLVLSNGEPSGEVALIVDGARVRTWPVFPPPSDIPRLFGCSRVELSPHPLPPSARVVSITVVRDPGPAGTMLALDGIDLVEHENH